MIFPVIMAGGSGTRLWPLSRTQYPKQFLELYGNETMLKTTVKRLEQLKIEEPLVICNQEHRFVVAEQLRELDISGKIVLEPIGRNTAPAIAVAAMLAMREASGGDPILLVLAADHVIQNESTFTDVVKQAEPIASLGKLITFGVIPTEAHTGYGYIRRGISTDGVAFTVDGFVEKPDLETAEKYVSSGNYYWNSGIFMFQASTYLKALEEHRPDIFKACELACAGSCVDLDFIRIDEAAFIHCPAESIDYAVMEKTSDAFVIPLDVGWSDVGSWESLWNMREKDKCGNVSIGDIISLNSNDNYIYSNSGLVATIGIDNVVIVNTDDALLVAAKHRTQDVKEVVDVLKKNGLHHYRVHPESFRPWGKISNIDSGDNYQVKKIIVHPGHGLSLQRHTHRAEHWIVLSGKAKVIINEKEFFLSENQSTFIPPGSVHTLDNSGVVDLIMIEVRSGDYLGEDDIVRLNDRYGRV